MKRRILIWLISKLESRKPANRFDLPPLPVVAAAAMGFPSFEYDLETFDPVYEGMYVADYINAKAREGWKLHTIQQTSFDDRFKYFLTWERLKRQGIADEENDVS